MQKKLKIKNKKAQQILGLSFSTIFSIFLIIFFIIIAIIVINAFLKTQNCSKLGLFLEDFQNEIDIAWNSQKYISQFKSNLPSNIEYVCFVNLSREINNNLEMIREAELYAEENSNFFFYPTKNSCEIPAHFLKHLNINQITSVENPYCIAIESKTIEFQIKKELNQALVTIV